MATIKIDNVDYDPDTLSNEVKSQLNMIQLCDQEIPRISALASPITGGGITVGRFQQLFVLAVDFHPKLTP